MSEIIIDVREVDEYAKFHIPNSLNIPLSVFRQVAPNTLFHFSDHTFVLMCGGGTRASKCLDILNGLEISAESSTVYPGGIKGWIKEDKEIVRGSSMAIIRFLNLFWGVLILTSVIASLLLSEWFLIVAALVAIILIYAGLKKTFPIYYLVMKAPWNKGKYLKR